MLFDAKGNFAPSGFGGVILGNLLIGGEIVIEERDDRDCRFSQQHPLRRKKQDRYA